jgi:hypothetical protein
MGQLEIGQLGWESQRLDSWDGTAKDRTAGMGQLEIGQLGWDS